MQPVSQAPFRPVQVGVIGCGNISKKYLKHCRQFPILELQAVADLDPDRARHQAAEFKIPKACTVEELLADPTIELVINLTIPQAHVPVNLAILRAGKHAYCEKPFSLTVAEGRTVLAEAARHKLLVGCAPDTVLGGGIQTCRKLIDDGVLGKPVAASANFLCGGHESWHPNPEFYYKTGGGPLFDMGPYYLTSLITFLGPARKVVAMNRLTHANRTILSEPLKGQSIPVEVPTHLTGCIEFANGVLATITMSFDVIGHHLPRLEIYGADASISCPDPNNFDGEVKLRSRAEKAWQVIPLTHDSEVERGIGVADLAYAIRTGRKSRVSGEVALHVVEIMEAFHLSATTEKAIHLQTTCSQPAALPIGLARGTLD
jgi:predicted dehydrogenase